MEVLFENGYVRNKQLAKEIYRYFYFQRVWLIISYILLLLSFIANILSLIFEGTYSLFILIFVPLLFFLRFYSYFRNVKMMVKRDREIHGKEITVETVVTSEYIQNTVSTGSVNKLEIGKIKKAVQTKNLILLLSEANLFYIFPKDKFTKGNAEDFIKFLKDNGVKVK